MPRRRLLAGLASLALGAGGCRRGSAVERRPPGPIRLVFQHQPFLGDPAPLQRLFSDFENKNEVSGKILAWLFNPEYGLITRALPGSINWLGTPGSAITCSASCSRTRPSRSRWRSGS